MQLLEHIIMTLWSQASDLASQSFSFLREQGGGAVSQGRGASKWCMPSAYHSDAVRTPYYWENTQMAFTKEVGKINSTFFAQWNIQVNIKLVHWKLVFKFIKMNAQGWMGLVNVMPEEISNPWKIALSIQSFVNFFVKLKKNTKLNHGGR